MCIRDSLHPERYLANEAPIVFELVAPTKALPAHAIVHSTCLLYTSDAADERSSVDLGGRRLIKKTNKKKNTQRRNRVEAKD